MKTLLLTHDLSCVIGNLAVSAARQRSPSSGRAPMPSRNLMIAAVSFAVQLAIDESGADPDQMRALERSMVAKLEEIEWPR
jgi:hypothetical protein